MPATVTADVDYDGRVFAPVPDDPARRTELLAAHASAPRRTELLAARASAPRRTELLAARARQTARGRFSQHGDLVRSEISGGSVRSGAMVGIRRADGSIDAVYCMVLLDGGLVAGTCRYEPTLLADGRLRFAEHWRRIDGSEGVSHIEEVEEDLPAGAGVPAQRTKEQRR